MEVEKSLELSISENKLKSLLSSQNEKVKELIKASSELKTKPPNLVMMDQVNKHTEEISLIEEGKYIQYSSLYISRLSLCIESLRKNAKIKWPKDHICPKILDLKGTVK